MRHYRAIVSALLASVAIASTAMAETGDYSWRQEINVGPGMAVRDIQTAVNVALPGDTVVVWPGVYEAYTPRSAVTVRPQMEGTVQIVPRRKTSPRSGGNGTSAFERNAGSVGRNIENTDEQVVREILQGEDGALDRLDGILSGRAATREINRAINKGTNAVTGAIDDKIDEATDAVFDPIEDEIDAQVDSVVQTVQCNFAGSALAAAGGAVSSIWGGGDATYGAQLAQWLTQTASNFCQGKQVALAAQQLKVEKQQRDLQKKMVKGLDADASANASGVERFSRDVLGSSDASLYRPDQEEIIWNDYQSGMPDDWTFDNAAQHSQRIREKVNLATQEAAAAQAAAKVSIDDLLMMADEAEALSMDAAGPTQAIQAQTQMPRVQIATDATRQAPDAANATAALRMEEERRAQDVFADQKIERFYGPGTLDLNAPPRRAVFSN